MPVRLQQIPSQCWCLGDSSEMCPVLARPTIPTEGDCIRYVSLQVIPVGSSQVASNGLRHYLLPPGASAVGCPTTPARSLAVPTHSLPVSLSPLSALLCVHPLLCPHSSAPICLPFHVSTWLPLPLRVFTPFPSLPQIDQPPQTRPVSW